MIGKMKRLLFFLIAVIGFLCVGKLTGTFATAASQKVLVISSYSYDESTVPAKLKGIEAGLSDNVDIDYQFMNTQNVNETDAIEDLQRQMENKRIMDTKRVDYQAVIVDGVAALSFAQQFQKEYFDNIPIVFMGITDKDVAVQAQENLWMTGIYEKMPIEETLEKAQALYPKAKNVVAVSCDFGIGAGILKQYYKYNANFSNLDFTDYNTSKYTTREILRKVSGLDENTILIYLSFERDYRNQEIDLEEGVRMLANAANIPMFKMDELGISAGALGGCVVSNESMGKHAAQTVQKIMDGVSVKECSLATEPHFYKYNGEAMKRFGITKGDVSSKDTVFVNYKPGFLEKHYKWIGVIIIGLLVAIAIIVCLARSNRKRIRLNNKLYETKNSLMAAVENAEVVYFEYYPELHYAVRKGEINNIRDRKEYFDYPESWLAQGTIHPKDLFKVRMAFKKIDSGAEFCEMIIRCMTQEQKQVWYHYKMKSIYNVNGERVKVSCVRFDITLQKELEFAYQRHLRTLILANNDTLASCRINLNQNKVSEVYDVHSELKINLAKNLTVEEVMQTMSKPLMETQDREKYTSLFSVEHLLETFRSGQQSVTYEYQAIMGNNEVKWLTATAEMVRVPQTGEVETVFFVVDSTYRHTMELLLENAANHDYDFLAFIFGNTQQFISYSKYHESDMQFREHFMEAVNELLDSVTLEEDIQRELEWEHVLQKLDEDGELTVYLTQISEDGSRCRKKIHFFYIDQRNKLILASQRDVTDVYENERRHQEELSRALDAANAANAAKTDFLSRMSHDIRTPMNAIIGITALAFDEMDDPKAIEQDLSKINSASHFLLGLVNDILDMTKIEDGAVELHSEPYRHSDFIGNIKTMFEPMCQRNGLLLDIQGVDESYSIYTDKVRLNQIFFNVFSNAIKYTPEGGTIRFYKENVKVEEGRHSADYIVEDTGIGMSETFQQNMFKPFTQENTSITTNIEGTGLGLSITKSLVELMGGVLTIESQEGVGTKVIIHMSNQLVEGTQKSENQKELAIPEKEISLEGKRVLLVEDHPLNTEIAKKILEKKKMVVYTTENGKLGVERFEGSTPYFFDVILMDIRMPVMTGLEAAKAIRSLAREDAKSVPIIAMTANAYDEDVQMSMDAGMNEHLAKPIEPKKLYDTLIKYMS